MQQGRPVTLVTGAGRGIGAATAMHLARAGHDVVINYLRDRRCRRAGRRDGRRLRCPRRADPGRRDRRARGGAAVRRGVRAARDAAHEYVRYAAAKAGVDALTVGLAKELAGDGIRVNAVAPGTVRTGIHADAGDPGRPDRVATRIPLGRVGEPTEVAPAIAWLLGEQASFVTGAVLRVAGGL